jgi:hypothetical protein
MSSPFTLYQPLDSSSDEVRVQIVEQLVNILPPETSQDNTEGQDEESAICSGQSNMQLPQKCE